MNNTTNHIKKQLPKDLLMLVIYMATILVATKFMGYDFSTKAEEVRVGSWFAYCIIAFIFGKTEQKLKLQPEKYWEIVTAYLCVLTPVTIIMFLLPTL